MRFTTVASGRRAGERFGVLPDLVVGWIASSSSNAGALGPTESATVDVGWHDEGCKQPKAGDEPVRAWCPTFKLGTGSSVSAGSRLRKSTARGVGS
jgi:hypothetical protein